MENFTDKDVKYFSDKVTEGYNRAVPKFLREDKPIDKDKEKSFSEWVQKLSDRLRFILTKSDSERTWLE